MRTPPPAAVAVGHDLALPFIDPGRAEGEDHAVGRAERLGARLPGGVHAAERLVGRGGREVAVESEMEPPLAVGVQLVAHDGAGRSRGRPRRRRAG